MPARRKPARAKPKRAAKPKPAPSEYESWRATLTLREQRVDEVVRMMAQGQWMAGVSHAQLAKKWGVVPGTVEHVALEANRILRRNFRTDAEGRKDATALILQTFEVIRVRAMLAGSAGGLRVALEATEALGRYLGLEPPKTIRTLDADDELDRLDDEQLGEVAKDGSRALRKFVKGAGEADGVH